MRFTDTYVSREGRYSLGRESLTGRPFLSIPVSNQLTDYKEYYRLNEAELLSFGVDGRLAKEFAERCGRREQDDRLFLAPVKLTGIY